MSTYGNAIIVQEVVSAVNTPCLRLNAASFARPVSLNAAWNQIRIGMRLLFTQLPTLFETTFVSKPSFAVGLCHGTTNIMGDATTDAFVGAISTSTNWASENAEVLYDFIDFKAVSKAGTTSALSGVITGTQSQFGQGTAAPWVANPQMFFVDITKGSPNYSVSLWYISNGQTAGLETRADFLSYLVQASPSKTGHTYSAAPGSVLAPALAVDAVNVSWDRTDFFPEILDLSIVTFS